ncbi:MAG: sarcosine oxidase subunit delta [Hyphomicrobiales bacterium]
MRIKCPFCGERDSREFSFLGQADLVRPDANQPDAQQAFHDYVHIRPNPAGINRELWLHAYGCRSWIIVERNTLSHAISSVEFASQRFRGMAQ